MENLGGMRDYTLKAFNPLQMQFSECLNIENNKVMNDKQMMCFYDIFRNIFAKLLRDLFKFGLLENAASPEKHFFFVINEEIVGQF